MTEHDVAAELLGAYALDAIDSEEASAIERHLDRCPRCRDELRLHRATAAALAEVGGPAPDGLWDRLVQHLEEPPPPLRLAPVVPLPRPMERASGGRRRLLAVLAGAVAASVVLVAFLGLKVRSQDQRMGDLAAAVGTNGIDRAVSAAIVDPHAKRVRMTSPDGRLTAEAVITPSGQAYLVRDALPTLPPGQTYQLWGVFGEQRVSLGLLGRNPGTLGFHVSVPPSGLAVTVEQAGGVIQPQHPPIVSGLLGLT